MDEILSHELSHVYDVRRLLLGLREPGLLGGEGGARRRMPHPSSKGNDDDAGPSPVGGGAGGESCDRETGSGSPSLTPG
jgi:hypothetical protein